MVTSTPSQERAASQRTVTTARSSVVLKAAMAITGLIMVLFLIAHMYGNLKVFAGKEAFDSYAESLRTIGTPILPHAGALWILRVVLLISVIVHIVAAVTLWGRARRATAGKGGQRYVSTKARRGVQRTYASFTMRWGGVVIGLFIIYHLLHLTFNTIHPGGASASPYERMAVGFAIWWVTVSYVVALLALGFHLRHGAWSAFASLGANTSRRRRRHLNVLATVVAAVITIGFIVPPLAILVGLI